jgi:acyl-CoA thioester hydrolase
MPQRAREEDLVRITTDAAMDVATYGFAHDIRVRFAETDAMGIVHHGSYVPYLEETRVAFLRESGHPYVQVRDHDGIEFPVVEVFVRYLRPLRFDDVVTLRLRVAWVQGAAFQIDYLLCVDDTVRASASTVHAVVRVDGRPTRPPAWLTSLGPPRNPLSP